MIVGIDVSGILYRCFHGIPMMRDEEDNPINALYGFKRRMKKLYDRFPDASFVACFDGRIENTFRFQEDKSYKQNRKSTPQDIITQFEMTKMFCVQSKMTVLEIPSYEADDLLASLCHTFTNEDKIVIVTYDKDLLQLLSYPNVSIYNPSKDIMLTEEYVMERYRVTPDTFHIYLALVGDQSDGIPGIKGVGPVKASKLIQKYGKNIQTLCDENKIELNTINHLIFLTSLHPIEVTIQRNRIILNI